MYIKVEAGESKLSVKLKIISIKGYLFTGHMIYRMVNLPKLVRCSDRCDFLVVNTEV